MEKKNEEEEDKNDISYNYWKCGIIVDIPILSKQ